MDLRSKTAAVILMSPFLIFTFLACCNVFYQMMGWPGLVFVPSLVLFVLGGFILLDHYDKKRKVDG